MPSDGTERRLPWKEAPVSGSAGLPAVMVVYVGDLRGHGAPRGGERAAAVRSVRGSASSESVPRHTSATSTGSCRSCRGAVGTATPRPDAGAMASRWGRRPRPPPCGSRGGAERLAAVRGRRPRRRIRGRPANPPVAPGEGPGAASERAGIVVAGSGRNKGSLKRRLPWTQNDGLRWRCWLGS